MTGRIPKYGRHFRRERLAYDPSVDLATRRYVLKSDPALFIRSTRDSEHWSVFVSGPNGAAFPLGFPRDTMTEAMRSAIALHEAMQRN